MMADGGCMMGGTRHGHGMVITRGQGMYQDGKVSIKSLKTKNYKIIINRKWNVAI